MKGCRADPCSRTEEVSRTTCNPNSQIRFASVTSSSGSNPRTQRSCTDNKDENGGS